MKTQFLAFGALMALSLLLLSVAGASESTVDTVIIATTANYPDAMVVAPASVKFGAPVLFTDPESIPQETLDALASLNPKTVVIVGGPFVIKQAVEDSLKAKGYNVVRLWGNTQYGTAVEIAKFFWADGVEKAVIVYDTTNAPFDNNTRELMAARVIAARWKIPMFLVPVDKLPDEVNSTLVVLGVKKVVLVGSRAALEAKLKDFSVEKVAGKDDDETLEKADEDRERNKIVVAAVADFRHIVAASVEPSEHASVILVSSEEQINSTVSKVRAMPNITEVKVVGKPELAQKICDAFGNTTTFKLECRKDGRLAKIAEEVREKMPKWKALNKELKFVRLAVDCRKLFEKDDENIDDASTDAEAADEGASDVAAANTSLGRAKALCEAGNFTQAMLAVGKARDEMTKIKYRLRIKATRNLDSDESDERAVKVLKSTQRLKDVSGKLATRGKAAVAINRILEKRYGERNSTGTAAAKKEGEKYCENDADCACGRHITAGNCFYGNADYVNTARQCPDFCTGIGGNLRIRCVNNECRQTNAASEVEKKFTIRGSKFKFAPSTMSVAKGERVEIKFINDDGSHNLCVGDWGCTKTVAQGQSDELKFTADKAGTFAFWCNVDGHRGLGMEGNLTVTG